MSITPINNQNTNAINGPSAAASTSQTISLSDSANTALLSRADALENDVRAQLQSVEQRNANIAGIDELVSRIHALTETTDVVYNPQDTEFMERLGINPVPPLTMEGKGALAERLLNIKDSLSSVSQTEMLKLQSLNGKFEQTNSLASQIMKSLFNQAKEMIRNIN